MENKELNNLLTLGTQFAQAFKDFAKSTTQSASVEIDKIYASAQKLHEINEMQTALDTTAVQIATAISQVQNALSKSIDRNTTVLDSIDDMDWALADEDEVDEDFDYEDDDDDKELAE
jgi:septal ring factor EnvC (AmiA/AmiB activator)